MFMASGARRTLISLPSIPVGGSCLPFRRRSGACGPATLVPLALAVTLGLNKARDELRAGPHCPVFAQPKDLM
jgi:hypothetical protein